MINVLVDKIYPPMGNVLNLFVMISVSKIKGPVKVMCVPAKLNTVVSTVV